LTLNVAFTTVLRTNVLHCDWPSIVEVMIKKFFEDLLLFMTHSALLSGMFYSTLMLRVFGNLIC